MTTPHDRFEPGDGWREISQNDPLVLPYVAAIDEEGKCRYWVREVPVPPLPTEPYTVIRAWWGTENNRVMCLHDGAWHSLLGNAYRDDEMAQVTRWEPLAEPRHGAVMRAEESARRLTAEAILDRVRFLQLNTLEDWTEIIDTVAREFGVSS